MAFVEILNFGCLPDGLGTTPGILGRSPGIQQDLADEVVRLCKGWGQPPVVEENRPAILSFPLKTKAKFAAKGAFAVIKVLGSARLLFRVAVIGRSDYAAFGYNPFAVVEAGAFPVWDTSTVVRGCTLTPPTGSLAINPPPSSEDVGMVDEALHQLLISHKLYLPIGKATAESDRCLALLLEVLPEALKQQLRFASFTPSPANGYHLAATATAGCDFIGWKRLMMTLVGGVLPESLDNYVKKVRDCLACGDLEVVRIHGKRLSLERQTRKPPNNPAPRVQPALESPAFASAKNNKSSHFHGSFLQQNAWSRDENSNLAQLRGRRRKLPAVAIALLVLVVTFGSGWTYLEFFHGGGGIKWDELVFWPGQDEESKKNRVASLLEVPNVCAVYSSQIKKIHWAGRIPGLNQESDQRRGVVNLKEEAAVPLLRQVDLFLELAAAGIRQGNRPDRERERLQALARQGHVLKVEMIRLELAWHSLSSGEYWTDLSHLSDSMVMARQDSLKKALPSALKSAAVDMSFGPRLKELGFATRQMGGMNQLLLLFQAPQWSPEWSVGLYRAAEMVSPSASAMTRAYRNSAFTLIRLKKAEHLEAFSLNAFVPELDSGVWPEEKVADILPGLRREAKKFERHEIPSLLVGTLKLYEALENPMSVVDEVVSGKNSMELLETNPAVLFDPKVYENHLERLRYQVSLKRPDLYVEEEQVPFLERWSEYENGLAQKALLSDLLEFDETWNDAQSEVEKLRSLAEQGRDWTMVWLDLDQVLERGLAEGSALVGQDPSVASRVEFLQSLRRQLGLQRELELSLVTVRLDEDRLVGQEEVVFEFRTSRNGKIHRSEPFNIGPAAPAGSGWVGTVTMSATVFLSPNQKFSGTLRSVDEGKELLAVDYPSLSEEVGPGALARPRSGRGGNLLIKTTDGWWRGIQFPEQKDSPRHNLM